MPPKGVGAHGGAPKWRHGWIPANAAARAIVARRKARALASEDSSSVTGVLVVNQRSDGWHVIEDTLGKSLAKFPTQEAARADLKRRERLERRAHLERLRLARSGQEKVNIDLRSPDPASGTPSLFRGRRNIVDLPLPPFLGQVPRLNGPHTAEDDAVNANPGYYSTLDTPAMGYEGELARVSRYRHQVNCYNCVQAWELRRRGYAVQAQEAPELWRRQGQSDGEIAAGWHTSEDNPSAFTHVKSPEVLPMIEDMPPGSRVFIVNTWREAGGHVFTAEKAQDGTVHFYDPQPGKEIVWNDYLSRSKTDMAVLRVDDLVPVDSVQNTVEPSAQTTPGTWRPSKTTMSTPVTDLPGMKKWLDGQMKGLTEQGAALPATANNKWQRDVLTARLSVYQAAAASTPGVIEDKLTILKGMEQEAKGNLGEDATERDYNAYKLIRIKRVTAEEILKKAVPNATGILVTGVPRTEDPKFPKLPAPETWEQALVGANPHYNHGTPMIAENAPWITNCVSCVMAFDLRRRGYAVEARPNNEDHGVPLGWLANQYRTADGKVPPLPGTSIEEIRAEAAAWPDGAWAMVDSGKEGGHTFIVIKEGGVVRYLDPQSGQQVQSGSGIVPYWYKADQKVKDHAFLRMDTLSPIGHEAPLVMNQGATG